jgi:hypothetical protein
MNKLFCVLLLASFIGCQKNPVEPTPTPEPPVVTPGPTPFPTPACRLQSIQEFPAIDKKNVTTTFSFDDNNRIIKLDRAENNQTISKTISYNAEGKVEKMTYTSGAYDQYKYTDGLLKEWETINENGTKVKKSTYTYTNGKLTREDRFLFNTDYVLNNYVTFEWDSQGNISTIKEYAADETLVKTSNYEYYTDKVNKQKELAPQLDLFLDYVSDVTAFINSNNLLKGVPNVSRTVVYETNSKGFITTVKGSNNDNYFLFTYTGCN